ncbi:LptA/OstA family protein [Candidatus Liberibacter brunswickensis]|uniref:LptA/OstA family protein n=1 Tax=Candidatus Liberibacter brunswickensis TaxID=1968796 RepID=UPI002FE2620D
MFGNEKIHIKSDILDVRDDVQKAFFLGNVRLSQGDFTLQAEEMTFYYRNTDNNNINSDKIDRMDIERNIVIRSGSIKTMASNGYFDFKNRVLVLGKGSGEKVILEENINTFFGCKLIVNLDTNVANLQGCGSDQVRSIIHYN